MPSVVQKSFRQVAVTNTKVLVEAGNKVLVGWNLINPNSTAAYLKLYNAAAIADVTLGTTVPVETLLIPPGPGLFWQSNEDDFQIAFNLGIVIAVVTEIADSGTSAPAIGCYVRLMYGNNN